MIDDSFRGKCVEVRNEYGFPQKQQSEDPLPLTLGTSRLSLLVRLAYIR